MKLIETIKQKARDWLLEDLDPFRRWKINWTQVTKENDDSNSIRREKLSKAFEAWERNPIGATAIEYSVVYILGKGLEYTTEHPDLEKVLDSFWKENQLKTGHVELVRSLLLDGEVFLYFPKILFGQTPALIPIDSGEIEYIARSTDDFRKVDYYHRKYKVTKYPTFDQNSPVAAIGYEEKHENIKAEDVIHFKIGSLLNLSRGRGMLFRVLESLDEFTHWLKIRKGLNKAKSAFAWVFKLGTDNQSDVDKWQAKLEQFAKYDSDGNMIDAVPIGQPLVIGKSMDVTAPSPGINAAGSAEDGRQIKLNVAAGVRLPEYMLSDGENANLATTQSQESPMVRCMEAVQEQVRVLFREILDRVIQMQVDVGGLNENYEVEVTNKDGVPEKVDKSPLELYDIIFPEIATTDIVPLAAALGQVVDRKILSRETSCTLLGYDWPQEKERIKKEQVEGFVSPVAPAGLPGMFGTMSESMGHLDLKNVFRLRDDCQKELRENFELYQKNLTEGVADAKELFIVGHQEIVKKYLDVGAKEGYAARILKTIK